MACSTGVKVKSGAEAFELKQYAVAIELLKSEFEKTKEKGLKASKAYQLAESYQFLLDYNEALIWYQEAISLSFGPQASFKMAYLQKKLGNYTEAIRIFQELRSVALDKASIDREISICRQVLTWQSEPNPFEFIIKDLGEKGNFSVYAPVLYTPPYLVVTSDKDKSTGTELYTWTGKKFSDLWLLNTENGLLSKFDPDLNSEHNEGAACFNKDLTEVIFTRCFSITNTTKSNCKLMTSKRVDGFWTPPQVVNFVDDRTNYGQPTLIENDEVLVFASESEDGANGYDLWYSERIRGGWSTPLPMPKSINTPGNEMFPTSEADTLYFSSDYLPGYGGLDIFKTFLRADGTWAPPVNIREPYNSGADDFGLSFQKVEFLKSNEISKAYLSSSRSFRGVDEIIEVSKVSPFPIDRVAPPVKETPKETMEAPIERSLFLAIKVYEDKVSFENVLKNNSRSKKVIPRAKVLILNESTSKLDTFIADRNGLVITQVNIGDSYTVSASMKDFLSNGTRLVNKDVVFGKTEEIKTINIDIPLIKIQKNQEIVLPNILYDLDKWDVREDAKPTLEKLAEVLKLNPTIRIELASHTDCRADENYNQGLSDRRANAVVNFLVSKGIDASRLVPKGYGETKLLIPCVCEQCTEEEHQLNRRTTFTIL